MGSKNFINHGIDESFFDLIDFDILQDETEVIVSHEPQIYGRDYKILHHLYIVEFIEVEV